MFSVIVVYNNKRALTEILLPSLESQSAKFELILMDNTSGQFRSCAEALNSGGKRAKGKYIMFVHQDVELDSNLWLENAERILDALPDLGIAGAAGMSEVGRSYVEKIRGYISDSGTLWGRPAERPEEVQTLDECLLIVPKSVFDRLQFDEKTFNGWHCYGGDYCLSVAQMGLKPYVIPAFIYHRSLRGNVENLLSYHRRLYRKHRKKHKNVYTTCGKISWVGLNLRAVVEIVPRVYKRLFPSWVERLKKELASCGTVLDLGCGYNSPLQHCNVPFSVGVELFDPYLQESKKKAIHNQYIEADVRKMELKPESFDAVLGIELLEHLSKEEGYEVLSKIAKWAKKKVIITTPNGYLWQDSYDDNPLQEHISGWSLTELKSLGFRVYGMNGWKKLRGCKGSIKCKPTLMWTAISDLTQKIAYHHPKLAFQLFATKQIRGEK